MEDNSSNRQTPREFLTEFIQLYRSFTCLWLVKSKEYSDRNKKDLAYIELVKKYKEVDPSADRNTVVKKINALRTVYKKELSKVYKSEKSGAGADDIYKPILWYFDLLSFLNDQDSARPSRTTMNDADEETQQNEDSETTDLHDFQAQQREVNISTDPTSCDDGSSTSQSATPTSSRLIAPQPKRKKNVNPTDNMIQLAGERLKQIRPDDEFDAYGKYVAYKLRSLKGKQAVFARKLMNDVIFEGELEALTKDFKVINMQSHHSDQRNDYQQFNPHLYPPTHISQMPDHQLSHSQAYPQQYNPRSSSNNSQTLYSQTLIHANNSEQSNSQQLNTQQPESQHLVNINANEANNKNITTYFSRFSP